jgi:hypothetical protein
VLLGQVKSWNDSIIEIESERRHFKEGAYCMIMHCKIPGTAREIIESLIINKAFSIQEIAENIGVSINTIYRIRKGCNPKPKTHLYLIRFYLYIFNKPYYTQNEVPCS